MDTISISTLAILAGKWQAEADAHVTSPSTYGTATVPYTHFRDHETVIDTVRQLLHSKKKEKKK